ncbi:MAG: hypothetical protein ACI3Z0_10485 [Candidatus Cryptobacteroides sp.]
MRSFLSKFCGMFLAGALFAVAGCTDYEQDIREINNKLDDEVAVSISNLDDAIKSLEAKLQSDYALKSEVDALKSSLETKINDEVVKLNASIASIQNSLDDLASKAATKDELASAKAELKAQIDKAVADANAAISSLNDEIAKLNANKADKSELETLKGTLEGEIASLKSELEGQINALGTSLEELGTSVSELQTSLGNLTTTVGKNTAAIESIKGQLTTIGGQITDLKGQIDDIDIAITGIKTRLGAVESAISENQTKISDLLEAVKDLQDRVTHNEKDIEEAKAAILKNADDIAANKTLIEANAEAIKLNAEAIIALNAADIAINSRIGELENLVQAHIESYDALKAAYDAFVEQYGQDKTALENTIANLRAGMNDEFDAMAIRVAYLESQSQSLDSRISVVENKVSVLESSVETLEANLETLTTTVESLNADFAVYKTTTDKKIEDLNTLIANKVSVLETAIATAKQEAINEAKDQANAALENAKTAIETAKTELDGKITALDSKIDGVRTDLTKVQNDVAALRVDVDKLLSRVQSLVYIPDYSDGKADINVLVLENKEIAELADDEEAAPVRAYIEGTSVLRYKVSPASYAADLATVAAEVFSYDIREVKIRTRAASLPEMTVVSAECVDAATGEIAVTVKTRNFGDAFYMGENSYSAALVLVQENDEQSRNISSEFTNLVPAVQPVAFQIQDVNNEDITNRTVEPGIEISYNSTKKYPVLKGHHPVFVLDGQNMTPEQMTEAGYEISVSENPAMEEFMADFSESDGCFLYETLDAEAYPYLEVYLANADKNKIGHTAYVQYNYEANGVAYYTGQEVVIVKEKATVSVADVTVDWTYALDAEVDAARFNAATATALYKRTFEYAVSELVTENVPEDIDLYELLTDAGHTTCFIGGKEVVGTTFPQPSIVKAEAENTIAINFIGFEWDLTYPVKFVVATDQIEVTFDLNIITVDRNREPLTVAIEPATKAEYVKNVVIRRGEYNYSMEPVFDSLVENENLGAGDMTAAEYLKEIFATEGHDNTGIINTIYGKQRGAGLAFMIGEDSYEISPEYEYAWFDTPEVELVVPLTKTFTTWYGQVITIEHTINFTLPGYDFEHVPAWVKKNEGSSDYYSRVMGKYTPGVESPAVSAFSVTDIDLDAAFDVIDAEGARLDTHALAELGLVTEFEIETENHGTGIVMTDNVLSYNDRDAFVDVKGNLYLVNDNDTRVQLPTNFDAGNKYSTYVVKKYDPIGTPVLNGEAPRIDVVDSKVYTVNMLDYITLKDNRDGRAAYDLIVDGKWLTGNGENGYAAVDVTWLYGLEINYSAVQDDIPVAVRKFFNFNEETGVLTFDASDNLTLVNEIVVPVKMTVDYTWGSKEIEFDVTFFRSNGDIVE